MSLAEKNPKKNYMFNLKNDMSFIFFHLVFLIIYIIYKERIELIKDLSLTKSCS